MNPIGRRRFLAASLATSLSPWISARADDAGPRVLGLALLGLGDYSANQLAPALMKTKHVKLRGIVTGSPEKIPVWQEKYQIPDGNVYNYENFDRIVDNKEIDIVYIVTPTGLHAEYAIRAAKAGKHVICEKPMAPTVEDCTRMIEAAKAAGVTLQMGYRLHWDPFHLHFMECARDGRFGAWKSISAANGYRVTNFGGNNRWRISRDLGVAGALYDVGVYAVQGQLYTAGQLPVRVTATRNTERPEIFTEVPETYEWVLEFADGRKADGMSSYGRNGHWLRAEMEKGPMELAPSYGYGGQKGFTPAGPMDFQHVPQQTLQMDGQALAILKKEASKVPGEMGRRDIFVIRGIMAAAESGKAHEFGSFPG
jgi:predicted dehydrogenase